MIHRAIRSIGGLAIFAAGLVGASYATGIQTFDDLAVRLGIAGTNSTNKSMVTAEKAAKQERQTSRPPVGVVAARATIKDVPIYATGLGAVQASVTVSIHPQVDGKLEEVLFKEGQQVKKGDVLARIDPRLFKAALDATLAKKAQDSALLVAAQKDLERFNELARNSFQSQQSIDQQISKVDQLKATITADDAAIETAQTQYDYTQIRAPSDGRIGIRLVDPGNLVHATDTTALATLVTTRPSVVLLTLPSQLLYKLRTALEHGAVEVVAFDQDNKQKLATGTLVLIDNLIDQSTSSIKLKAIFPNDGDALWPGLFVNARVLIEVRKDAVTVPAPAIQRGPNGLFAWVIGPADVALAKPIEVGPITDDAAIVTSGLSDGDRVVVEGHYKLEVGAKVRMTSEAGEPSPNKAKAENGI